MKTLVIAGIMLGALAGCGTEPGRAALPETAGPTEEAAQPAAGPKDAPPEKGGRATAKPGAPVDIAAEVGASGARVALAFRADAGDVSVEVWGADGLAVEGGGQPIAGRSFRGGDRVDLQVAYAAPSGAGTLAVRVSGTFGSRRLSTVRSFTVGAAVPASSNGTAGELQTDGSGRRVRVMRPQ
jgi:hypothetical protein